MCILFVKFDWIPMNGVGDMMRTKYASQKLGKLTWFWQLFDKSKINLTLNNYTIHSFIPANFDSIPMNSVGDTGRTKSASYNYTNLYNFDNLLKIEKFLWSVLEIWRVQDAQVKN